MQTKEPIQLNSGYILEKTALSRIYEDEGDNYNYESGKYATIPITYIDDTRKVIIGARNGRFTGMDSIKVFNIVYVSNNHGTGEEITAQPDYQLVYTGEQVSLVPKELYLYEAENAQMYNVEAASSNPGFSGTGYADFGGVGSYIKLPVYASDSGEKVFTITYANGGSTDRGVSVTVNGTEMTGVLNFPVTSSWSDWKTLKISLKLVKGLNYIQMTTVTDAGGPNIDKLETAPVLVVNGKKETAFGVKYNQRKFTIQAYKPGADLKVALYSINGKVVFTRKMRLGSSVALIRIPQKSFTTGSYLLKTFLDGATEIKKIQILK